MLSVDRVRRCIREYVQHPRFSLVDTRHAKQRMQQRDINYVDVQYVLEHGYIKDIDATPHPSNLCKCVICGRAPHPGSRTICLVVALSAHQPTICLITVMWEDL